jgi:hypothetical protein
MDKSPSDLIFEALCLRFRATTNVSKVMPRQDLQDATGLPAEALVDALHDLVGLSPKQDLFIRFVNHDPDQITMGPTWVRRCEGKDA